MKPVRHKEMMDVAYLKKKKKKNLTQGFCDDLLRFMQETKILTEFVQVTVLHSGNVRGG